MKAAFYLIGAGVAWIVARPVLQLTAKVTHKVGTPLVALGVLGYVVNAINTPPKREEVRK